MKPRREEVRMKKLAIIALTILSFSLLLTGENPEKRQFVNVSFTVWKLENGASDVARRINTPIPEVFRESWIYEAVSFDVTGGKTTPRVIEKGELRFVLIAEPDGKLMLKVQEEEKELFKIIHTRPSTIDTIFYASDNQAYLIEATSSFDHHPRGVFSPGIRK
jgi:hypothetical protein